MSDWFRRQGTRASLLLALLLCSLAGCGRPDILSREKAIALATRTTPLATVDDAMTTPPGPVMWCLLGAGAGGRPMAVWVRRTVEGHLYLDQGTSRAAAVATAQRLAADMGYTEVSPRPVLVDPEKPVWWVAVKLQPQYWGHIWVDFATGEATLNPNDPWQKATP